MSGSGGFWSIACPGFCQTSSWQHDITWAHVKLRWIYSPTNVLILFLCLLLSHSPLALWIWPGDSYLCEQTAANRAGLNCEMLFLGLHWMQKWSSGENKSCHIVNSSDVQWICNQVMLLHTAPHQQQATLSHWRCQFSFSTSQFFCSTLVFGSATIKNL